MTGTICDQNRAEQRTTSACKTIAVSLQGLGTRSEDIQSTDMKRWLVCEFSEVRNSYEFRSNIMQKMQTVIILQCVLKL